MKIINKVATLIVVAFLAASCGSGDDESEVIIEPEIMRPFKMGFTPWPYEASIAAIDTTYSRIAQHGDLIKHHLQMGVPWQAAFDQTDYHPNVETEIASRLAKSESGATVFLAIDSLNMQRDALSDWWAESTNMARQGDWADRSWSDPEVITAFINFSTDMIERFQPEYFDYGTEVSELILNDLNGYQDYLVFAQEVYQSLKTAYPELHIFFSVAAKSPDSIEMQSIQDHLPSLIPFTDMLGLSLYPYAFFDHDDRGDPRNIPTQWLDVLQGLAPDKPVAVTETGWIAENLEISQFQYAENSDPFKQSLYVDLLLSEAAFRDFRFVVWYTTTDFDALWQDTLAQDPIAKIWKDTGLYDENQQARPALETWDMWLSREIRPTL